MHVRAIKELFIEESVFACYAPQLPIRITADVSTTGLGQVLEQSDTE